MKQNNDSSATSAHCKHQLENCTLREHPELGNMETILIAYGLKRGLPQEIILKSSSVGLLRRSIFSIVVNVE